MSHAHNLVFTTVSLTSYSCCGLFLAFAVAIPLPEYGGGSGRIHHFSCAGNENGLLNCSSDLDVDYCNHFEDVGVLCYNGLFIDLRDHSLTLKFHDPQRSVMRLMLDWLMAGLLMMDGWRYVLRGCGDLCVTTVGMTDMLKWCVDN